MRIRHLSVKNFRGIQNLDWTIPDGSIQCLIGRGDSTKSTILEAIRRAFYPQWNLQFDDADFYLANIEHPIEIMAVVTDLTDSFLDLERYGGTLCGWNSDTRSRTVDPGEGLEDAILVRLKVAEDLEPSWTINKDEAGEGIPFKARDRAKVAVSLIGTISDRHLTWSRGSILGRLAETDNISSTLAGAARAAKTALDSRRTDDLTSFDTTAQSAEHTARALGVRIHSTYKANLDTEAINVRAAGLALHDGEMPLRQLGLGSKRMLMTGLQRHLLDSPHITLFDEVEVGLEPHRIARLLQNLQSDTKGQYFLTTHSPVVLREFDIERLNIVHCTDGQVEVIPVNLPASGGSAQGAMRSHAEAFLAPKIVICEGATEVGFLRGLDHHWTETENKSSFAYNGIALVDAGGASKIQALATRLKHLGYDVAVLADSDETIQFSDRHADELRDLGVTVIKWSNELSIEEQVFADLPWSGVVASFGIARCTIGNDEPLLNQVRSQFGPGFNRDADAWMDSPELRTALGKAAKASGWFKQQSSGRDWATAISHCLLESDIQNTDLVKQLAALRTWMDNA